MRAGLLTAGARKLYDSECGETLSKKYASGIDAGRNLSDKLQDCPTNFSLSARSIVTSFSLFHGLDKL
jgi:hypothetical protein